jgi:hypothetical protein
VARAVLAPSRAPFLGAIAGSIGAFFPARTALPSLPLARTLRAAAAPLAATAVRILGLRTAALLAILTAPAAPWVAAGAAAAASPPGSRHQALPKIIATFGSAGSTFTVTSSPALNGADG